MVWSMTSHDPPFPQNWSPKCTPRDMSNFEWPYLSNGRVIHSSDPLHVWFQDRLFHTPNPETAKTLSDRVFALFGFGVWNSAISNSIKPKIAASRGFPDGFLVQASCCTYRCPVLNGPAQSVSVQHDPTCTSSRGRFCYRPRSRPHSVSGLVALFSCVPTSGLVVSNWQLKLFK